MAGPQPRYGKEEFARRGDAGRQKEIEAIVDIGFNGSLTLPLTRFDPIPTLQAIIFP